VNFPDCDWLQIVLVLGSRVLEVPNRGFKPEVLKNSVSAVTVYETATVQLSNMGYYVIPVPADQKVV
jgi:hypothetical protein